MNSESVEAKISIIILIVVCFLNPIEALAQETNETVSSQVKSVSEVTFVHPSDGFDPIMIDPLYGTEHFGYDPLQFNIDNLEFVKPYPSIESLSSIEKYMLWGSMGSSIDPQQPMYSYLGSIGDFLSRFDTKYGYIPEVVDNETVEVLLGPEVSEVKRASLINPITGASPVTNAVEFSPGDIYFVKLTDDQKKRIATRSPFLANMWYMNQYYDHETGETIPIEMLTDVYYIRGYGLDEIIQTKLYFAVQQ